MKRQSIFFIFTCFLYFSCATPEQTRRYNLDLVRGHDSQYPTPNPVNNVLEETKQTNGIVLSTAERTKNTSSLVDESIIVSTKAIKSSFTGKARNDLLIRLQDIQGNTTNIGNEISDIESRSKNISEFLSPSNINNLSNQLVAAELDKFYKNNGTKKLKEKDRDRIRYNVEEELIKQINNKSKEIFNNNERLSVLVYRQNSIAFEIKTVEANLALSNFIWKINNRSTFETGHELLTIGDKILITEDINLFFDSLFNRMKSIMSILINDTSTHVAKLNLYIEGFADSQMFSDTERSQELNKNLSQKRSDEIMKIVLDVFYRRTWQKAIDKLSYAEPSTSSIGYGEVFPEFAEKYKDQSRPDVNRRITLLQCTFRVD